MNVVLFEDSAAKQLAPISLTRPAWAIRCASFRLIDLVRQLGNLTSFVRPHLQTLQLNDWPNFSQSLTQANEPVLMVNARLAPSIANFQRLLGFFKQHDPKSSNQIILVRCGWALAAAIVPGAIAPSLSTDCEIDRVSELENLATKNSTPIRNEKVDFQLFDYPHDVIAIHMSELNTSVNQRIENNPAGYMEVQDGVFVAESEKPTKIPETAVFDTSEGPVVFESNVRIGPFCFFRGPVHVGANVKVSEHSAIKDSVAIAHTCKMGGEIEGVQTEPWSNKQHYGFLGHSYVGSWINLGAGTCNSDLKNTYGTVNMVYGDRKVSTGMQFVGCVMGDYCRTAINTSIYTGKTIGVGSSVYGVTPHNVPSFVNGAQSLNQYGVLPAEVLATTQKRMFGRRNVAQRPCDIQLLHDAFALTQHERDPSWTTDPISF